MPSRLVLLLSLTALLLFSSFSFTICKPVENDDEEDLSFLEEPDEQSSQQHHQHYPDLGNYDEEASDADDLDEFSDFDESEGNQEALNVPVVDDKDVVVLKERNFTDVIENNQFVMVEFYAPWCGHCQALAPEYAAAATELKGENVVLAKVDATEENELSQEYDVQGFPTVLFFIDGVHKPYTGQRTKDAIVTWIKKKIGPGIYNITTLDEAERILTSESKIVLGYLNSLVGPESEELAAASRLEDDVNFYQTREDEKLSHFDGQFVKSAIVDFVFSNKLPLVTTFTRESAPLIFESKIKKQLLLFVTSNDSEKVLPEFQEAAKIFKGKLIFVHVEMDNEDVGKPVSDYFGISGDSPKVLAYTGNDDATKFVLEGEVTLKNIKAFGEDFLEDKLKPFFKSDPVPESNDSDSENCGWK
ncbi:Protein disulfide-isomerase [Quillaja saponaria]|uniref:protein disulfide-isomerase n=1 Tax=Quillaja saponaria TaxID=32244 RepID=A0AAD7KXZ3_QUISA|nr:Protein disulfide-isomerase [Quillaja saponaria]